ncbi:MAG: IS481 family transposase [Dehalococcoidia bacterium]
MKTHANARLTVRGRLLLCERVTKQGWRVGAAGISARRAAIWLARFRAEGIDGLADRSSAPHTVPHRTSDDRVAVVERLRRLRMTSPQIAIRLRMALSTVTVILKRIGLHRLSRLAPPEPPNRYERRHAGELVHIDVKKLGRIGRPGHRVNGDRRTRTRGIGWEYVHVCIDDATRVAYVEVLEDETAVTAAGFLRRAVAYFATLGVRVRAVLTDNGSPYVSRLHATTCSELGLRHLRTQPYRPRTNGKAERFIRTMLAEWAYAATYRDSVHRRVALVPWLAFYNHRRPHGSLGHQAPADRLHRLTTLNNVPGIYT